MIRALTILCIVAAPAFAIWEAGLVGRFGITLNPGEDYYINLPITTTEAESSSWEKVTPPTQKTGYELAELWCPENNRTVCLMFDDTGYVMGVQVAIDPNDCSVVAFDWETAGFVEWTTTLDSATTTLWAHLSYFASADFYATDASTRVANRDSDYILQDTAYYVNCFGQLISVPTNTDEMSNTDFTEQSCIYGMGTHYYYKMTKDLTCSADTVCTSFPLVYAGQPIGLGFMLPATCTVPTGRREYWERPTKSNIKMIVPNAPDCLYEYGDNPGVITFHLYWVKKPYQITCFAGLG